MNGKNKIVTVECDISRDCRHFPFPYGMVESDVTKILL
jgi:hypothetical protein